MNLQFANQEVIRLEKEYDRKSDMGVDTYNTLKQLDYYRTIVKSFKERVQVKGGYMENGKVTLV